MQEEGYLHATGDLLTMLEHENEDEDEMSGTVK